MEFLQIAQTVTVIAIIMWGLALAIIFGLLKIYGIKTYYRKRSDGYTKIKTKKKIINVKNVKKI